MITEGTQKVYITDDEQIFYTRYEAEKHEAVLEEKAQWILNNKDFVHKVLAGAT